MKTQIVIIVGLVILGVIGYNIIHPLSYSPKGRVKILMAGRSTMALWFKHWNWPYPLRIKTTYRSWPISYHKYARGKLFFEYLPLDGPRGKDPAVAFGERMLKSFEAGLDRGKYDAAFFKFCFVDFPVKEEELQVRFDDLKRTVVAAHEITQKRKIKLIVGNALPLQKPSEATLRLQREYNAWLQEFAASKTNVIVFDLFGLLTDKNGRLKEELARGEDDNHPNDVAFSLLDETFFNEVSERLRQ
jgi:hypothetical protein